MVRERSLTTSKALRDYRRRREKAPIEKIPEKKYKPSGKAHKSMKVSRNAVLRSFGLKITGTLEPT